MCHVLQTVQVSSVQMATVYLPFLNATTTITVVTGVMNATAVRN